MAKPSLLAWIVTAAALLGAGCATVVPRQDLPNSPYTGLPTTETITARITCELAGLLYSSERNRDVLLANDVDVAFQLSLSVTDAGTLAPSFTYLQPPTFMFNAGANFTQSREQNYFHKIYYSFRQLDREIQLRKQIKNQDLTKTCPEVDTNLAGDLGLRQTFELAMSSLNRLQWDAKAGSATDGAFGGYVNFVVTKNLNMVGPTWMLTHFRGPGNLAGISEMNNDKLTFAFAQGANAGKPIGAVSNGRNGKAEALLAQIQVNQLANQLSGIRQALQ